MRIPFSPFFQHVSSGAPHLSGLHVDVITAPGSLGTREAIAATNGLICHNDTPHNLRRSRNRAFSLSRLRPRFFSLCRFAACRCPSHAFRQVTLHVTCAGYAGIHAAPHSRQVLLPYSAVSIVHTLSLSRDVAVMRHARPLPAGGTAVLCGTPAVRTRMTAVVRIQPPRTDMVRNGDVFHVVDVRKRSAVCDGAQKVLAALWRAQRQIEPA